MSNARKEEQTEGGDQFRTIQNVGRVIVTLMCGVLIGVVVFVLYLLQQYL